MKEYKSISISNNSLFLIKELENDNLIQIVCSNINDEEQTKRKRFLSISVTKAQSIG